MFSRSSLDSLVCIGWGPWFNTKGHVLMCCFWSERSHVVVRALWRRFRWKLWMISPLQLPRLCPPRFYIGWDTNVAFLFYTWRKWSELNFAQNITYSHQIKMKVTRAHSVRLFFKYIYMIPQRKKQSLTLILCSVLCRKTKPCFLRWSPLRERATVSRDEGSGETTFLINKGEAQKAFLIEQSRHFWGFFAARQCASTAEVKWSQRFGQLGLRVEERI